MSNMKEISRREFLKTASINFAALAFMPRDLFQQTHNKQETEKKFVPKFEFIGPPIKYEIEGGSDGERSGYVDPDDADRILVGTWNNGIYETINGGKVWKNINIPTIQKENRPPSVARDMLAIPDTKDILVVFDYNLAIGTLGNPDWNIVKLPSETYVAQTACILPNKSVLIGGSDYHSIGIYVAKIDSLKETIKYNKANPNSRKEFEWEAIKGLSSQEYWFFIRTITHVPSKETYSSGKIYFGGWLGMQNSGVEPGTGLLCMSDDFDEGYKLIKANTHEFADERGNMSVNTIKATDYKGHQIIFVGGEGSGYKNGRMYDSKRPFLQIIVDGNIYPIDKVNCKSLAESGGGSDLISPQRGIVVCEETEEVFISTGFKEISRASLDDIVQGKVITWERISKAPVGQKDFGALHLGLSHSKTNRTPILTVCREIYGKGMLPFQEVGRACLTSDY
jgi:hypothetical protein